MSERALHPEVLAHVEFEAAVVREAVSGVDYSARTSRAGRVRKLLKAEQVEDPLEFVVHEIARALGTRPPDVPLTEDFLAFSTEHELSEDMHDQVRRYGPAAAIEAYERRRWLRFPDDFL